MSEEIHDCIHARMTGTATPEQERLLDAWLEGGAENRAEYAGIAEVWLAAEWGGTVGALGKEAGWRGIVARRRMRRQRRWTLAVGAVASGAVLCLAVWPHCGTERGDRRPHDCAAGMAGNGWIEPGEKRMKLLVAGGECIEVAREAVQLESGGTVIDYRDGVLTYDPPAEARDAGAPACNELWVPRGGECRIRLGDGSGVWVNAESYLRYPVRFTGGERRIYVEGEAFFDVESGAGPFVVETPLGEITVLGTAFGVRAYPDEPVYTTLTRGRVRFEGAQSVELEPGEQAVASPSGKVGKRPIDTAQFVGWKDGMYVFCDRTLGGIMKQLARWYDINVYYDDPALEKLRFTGNLLRYDCINGFMNLLASTGEIRYRIDGRDITIYHSAGDETAGSYEL